MRAKGNPLRTFWNLGRTIANSAAFAVAGNPPQLSVIVAAAVLGYLLDVLPGLPVWTRAFPHQRT